MDGPKIFSTLIKEFSQLLLITENKSKQVKDINYFTFIWWICISIWLNLIGNAIGILPYKDILNNKLLDK